MPQPILPTLWLASLCLSTSVAAAQDTGESASDTEFSAAALAQAEQPVLLLAEETVWGSFNALGARSFTREQLNGLASANGDITQLLKLSPNVQFDQTANQSLKQGEIDPANISINGAKFYHNAFLLDGLNLSNHLDPAETQMNAMHKVAGSAYGLNLDSRNLCQLTVYDANVPAEYGEFTGGVVEAETCEPTEAFSGQISYQLTQSKWLQQHVDRRYKAQFKDSSDADLGQPKFRKSILRASLQGKPSQDLSLIASFSRSAAKIPVRSYRQPGANLDRENDNTQTRQLDNYFLKAFYHAHDDLSLEASILYAPGTDRHYMERWQHSGWTKKTGGTGVNLAAYWDTAFGLLSQRLTYKSIQGSRTKEEMASGKWWMSSPDKDWAGPRSWATEGGRGEQHQGEKNWSYSAKMDWQTWHWGEVAHRLQTGLELAHTHAYYRRPQRYEHYNEYVKNTDNCIDPWGNEDFSTCSLTTPYYESTWVGQFFNTRTVYHPGKLTVNNYRYALFMQDELQFNRLSATLGLRYQTEQLTANNTLAPRSSVRWDIWGDQQTQIEAGANRYYGGSLYTYQLSVKQRDFFEAQERDNMQDPWRRRYPTNNFMRHNQLKLPYDDEIVLGLQQQALGHQWRLQWVKRQGRDQVALKSQVDPLDANKSVSYFYNGGRSQAETLTVSVETQTPYQLAASQTHAMFALDKLHITSDHATYDTTLESLGERRLIRYNGQIMREGEQPVSNFNRPWSARLLLNTEIEAWNLTIGNFFRYRAAYREVVRTGRIRHAEQWISDYQTYRFPSAFTWDLTTTYDLPITSSQSLFTTLSVTNVLNKRIPVAYGDEDSFGRVYDAGRQLWVEVGYRF